MELEIRKSKMIHGIKMTDGEFWINENFSISRGIRTESTDNLMFYHVYTYFCTKREFSETDSAGAVLVDGGKANFEECLFEANTATDEGGALFVRSSIGAGVVHTKGEPVLNPWMVKANGSTWESNGRGG